MHLVCPGCQYNSNHNRTLQCPQCGSELEELTSLRSTRSAPKMRRQFKPRRDPKRTRRRAWTETEAHEL